MFMLLVLVLHLCMLKLFGWVLKIRRRDVVRDRHLLLDRDASVPKAWEDGLEEEGKGCEEGRCFEERSRTSSTLAVLSSLLEKENRKERERRGWR